MRNRGYGRRDFRAVSAHDPCPVCRHTDWCRASTDGAIVLCRRVAAGCVQARRYRDGGEYYVHRIHSATASTPAPQFTPRPQAHRAGADTLHQVYAALLNLLPLDGRHVAELRRRGLAGDLRAAGYRTWPLEGRARLARQLIERGLERHFPLVPGFRQADGERGGKYWTVGGSPGLFIPCLDVAGRIVKLLIRLDAPNAGGGKYSALSSQTRAKVYGPGPGAPIHVPPFAGDKSLVRLTEGVLKADVATALSGILTLGLPSAIAHRDAATLLHQLGAQTVRLAFDADARRNHHVARPLQALAADLAGRGVAVELELWDEDGGRCKGIDDLLAAGRTPQVLAGAAVAAAVAGIVADAKPTAAAPIPARRVRPDPRRPGHYIIDFTAGER